ncbi:MAG: glycerol-3-phosphate acyltransferase [Cyanobacteriota bacterium]|nr:glycerol-3-phosphate acyltransferase [Cyanobacteriota bacterium]
MTLTQVWGSLIIFLVCPILGALPVIDWITRGLTGRKLQNIGTGNISVSAAFYHGGKVVGILAVLSEAAKGILAVLAARAFFPDNPGWELFALFALVVGRYWGGKGAGTTNVVWGVIVHDWRVAFLTFLIGGVSFTIFRDRATGRMVILILLSATIALLHPHDPEHIVAAIALSLLLAWIYHKIPDDLDLSRDHSHAQSRKMFRFFQGDKAVLSLDNPLNSQKVGQKAATLSQLKRGGYAVPEGWVLPAGDDPQPLILSLSPSPDNPLVVRSSAVGEDSETASAAGQYLTVLNATSPQKLEDAITQCQTSYNRSMAARYRQDRNLKETSMSVLVQRQIQGAFSGVAFSRDPVNPSTGAVVIEALPGDATRVVSGQVTPEQYRVFLPEGVVNSAVAKGEKKEDANSSSTSPSSPNEEIDPLESPLSSRKPEGLELVIEGSGDVPKAIIQEVALLTRELEERDRGLPQDVEWTHDGHRLWILQARPITTLRPIWTRKIAAEAIPGLIRPLTWSINRPLTCGVWGDLFSLVLGKRARGLDFEATATLHYSHAYFNATLLGEIFLRMGLPPESLEFLTRGAKFSKPPFSSTLRNTPGLLKLFQRERNLLRDFRRDFNSQFEPVLADLERNSPSDLSPSARLERIDRILLVLRRATYYSILAPLSLALRQAILKVDETDLDNSQTPEVEATRSLAQLAVETRKLLPIDRLNFDSSAALFAYLADDTSDGVSVVESFNGWLDRYGYLSEVATDIAVPRWRDSPQSVRELFAQYLLNPNSADEAIAREATSKGGMTSIVQQRLNLKGKVTEVYSRLLAHLRWCFTALEEEWLRSQILQRKGDIFFLTFDEVRQLIHQGNPQLRNNLSGRIQQRQQQLEKDRQLPGVPFVVYGDEPAMPSFPSPLSSSQRLQGIGASPGQVEGRVKIARSLQDIAAIDKGTILVVPYTDSGWSPLLARAGGLIAEVGGKLSHGAIVAREYGIPAVMDVHSATQLLRDGQQVRVDGGMGVVEVLS